MLRWMWIRALLVSKMAIRVGSDFLLSEATSVRVEPVTSDNLVAAVCEGGGDSHLCVSSLASILLF